MYQIYLLVIHILLPLAILRLYLLGIRNPGYRRDLQQRLGRVQPLPAGSRVIWIHAVSVGEVNASKPLVEFLHENYPGYTVLMTTVTPTGAETVEQQYQGTVLHSLMPFDLPVIVDRFIRSVSPVALLIMETEIWPVLYKTCRRRNVPIGIVNARLSEKSLRGYRMLGGLTRETLAQLEFIAAQSTHDAERFISLGADANKIHITGTLKFDINIPRSAVEAGESIRQSNRARVILVAASTHEGEEEQVLDAFKKILAQEKTCLLVLVPRHPERGKKLVMLGREKGFATRAYSEPAGNMNETEVFVLDTLGQLNAWYAAADVAFVGGSLVDVGGHNLLEPASLGLAILCGPRLQNFQEVKNLLQSAGALIIVDDADQLAAAVTGLLRDHDSCRTMGENARRVVEENRGNIYRLSGLIQRLMEQNRRNLS